MSLEEELNQCHLQTSNDVKPHICFMPQIPINPSLYSKTKRALHWDYVESKHQQFRAINTGGQLLIQN